MMKGLKMLGFRRNWKICKALVSGNKFGHHPFPYFHVEGSMAANILNRHLGVLTAPSTLGSRPYTPELIGHMNCDSWMAIEVMGSVYLDVENHPHIHFNRTWGLSVSPESSGKNFMDSHAVGRPQYGGTFHSGAGRLQGRGSVKQKCHGCVKPGRGLGDGCGRGPCYDEHWGDSEEAEQTHGCGHCCNDRAGNFQGQAESPGITKFEVEFLKRLQDLELQARKIRGENLDQKKIIVRLYNLAYTTHTEMKAQQQKIIEKIEHLEKNLGLVYSRKVQKREVPDSEIDNSNRKAKKMQSYMGTAGNVVDLST